MDNNDDDITNLDEVENQNTVAILEFLSTFVTVSTDPLKNIADLADGVALFEALSEMYVLV
jgi:hypothetical protein